MALTLAIVGVTVPASVTADVGPPAHLQIAEREPGVYSVRWRVPTVLPPRAVPTPQLPGGCRPTGNVAVTNQAGAWLFEQAWRCDDALTGREVGLSFPFPDLALTTVARVELLSGDRFARLLTPGDPPWRLPEGSTAPDPLDSARDAVVLGIRHAATSWAHVALVLGIALLGRVRRPLWLLSVFTAGQIVGTSAAAALGASAPPAIATMAMGLAAALLAREALGPEEQRRRLAAVAALAGAVHGAALAEIMGAVRGDELAGVGAQLLAVLGVDATQLVGACGLVLLISTTQPLNRVVLRRIPSQAVGALGAALALAVALGGGPVAARDAPRRAPFGNAGAPAVAGGATASQRVAPNTPEVALQSFLTIEPFEVRHEVMIRLAEVAQIFDLDAQATMEIAEQQAIAERAGELVLEHSDVNIDGAQTVEAVRRIDFMSVDATGALPRTTPRPEPVAEAVLGVVVRYPTAGMPQRVSLAWRRLPAGVTAIPATVIDPEGVRSATLSAGDDTLTWDNELLDDPIPTLSAIPVVPRRIPVPVLSLPLLLVAGVALLRCARGERRAEMLALTRVAVAVALVIGPLVAPTFAVPGSTGRLASEAQARRLLAGLLPNVYRALEFREEARIYDRLAITVTGETLTDIYLQQRRALELEERGGAQARVQAVEVLDASEVVAGPDGFTVRAQWVVGGMVTHFGHRHFRQNRYDARLGIAAVDGTWKIRAIDVLEQERVQ